MITRENIIHFYTKYKENLKTEDQIQENLLKAEDQEAWIENLKNKSRMMRRLYIENEALLNLYIRPFLDGEASLNEELAREFLHQIRMADDEGYEDNLAMLEILELLDEYFQKSDDLDSYIWTLNLLGNFYNRPFSDEDGKKGAMYFDRLRALSSRYFEIEDFDVRKRILFSYYNFPIVLMNFNLDTSKELLQYIDEALEFYNDEKEEYLAPNCEPGDWEKVRLKIRLSELSHIFLEQEGSYECEARIRAKDAYRWVRFQFICLDEENAMPGMMTLIATDVQESHSRNEQLMNSLKEAYQSAEEANKAKSIFLSSMSHDIRTPMNGILGMTQIAMNHLNDPARILDCLQKIDDSSRHLLELINEVLDMSKIESGDTTLHEEPLYLSKTMKIVDGVCRQAAVDKHQIFDMDIEEIQDDHVLADPVRLRQVLINLISNGVKYTPEHGCVQVKVAQGNSFAEGKASYSFEVKDNGIGMSEEFQKKLFEPFSREDNSMTNATQGTGLGLSIAKSIIAQMGGSIEVKSIQGKGTTFLVRLDLKLVEEEKEADQALLAAEAGEEKEKDPGFLKGRRIMLVEDNELNREIAYELLSESGLIVDVAENGQEAIKLLGIRPENYYELIFMDIQMPVMNGYEATATIRAGESDYWKTIPVIAMTANVFQEDESRAAECGMSDYVTKPIDMNVIYSVLEKWLRGQKG